MGVAFGVLRRKVLKMDTSDSGGGGEPPTYEEALTMAGGADEDVEMRSDRRRPRTQQQTPADVLENWNKKYDEVMLIGRQCLKEGAVVKRHCYLKVTSLLQQ